MKIINGIILLFLSLNSYAQHVYSYDKQNMYESLVISDEYKIVQLSDSKIYLIKKQNHQGCQRLMKMISLHLPGTFLFIKTATIATL